MHQLLDLNDMLGDFPCTNDSK